jgi:hypothetical protein
MTAASQSAAHRDKGSTSMHRKLAIALTAGVMALPVGLVGFATLAPASAATATCSKSVAKTTPPAAPTAYPAGSAGSVTVGPTAGGLQVVSVAPNAGWKPRVDTATGPSVDVYFRKGATKVKFEASIEGKNRMRLLVRTCG